MGLVISVEKRDSLDKNANTKTQKYYNIHGKLSSPQQLVNQLNDYSVNISDASAGKRMTPHTSAWLPTTNEVSIGQVKLVLKNLKYINDMVENLRITKLMFVPPVKHRWTPVRVSHIKPSRVK